MDTSSFRFLSLPKELRLAVYEIVWDLDAIDGIVKAEIEGDPESFKLGCSLLLINRQIYGEAIRLTPKNFRLSYGLPDHKIETLISPARLRKFQHIDISDTGFRSDTIASALSERLFKGLRKAVRQLATIYRAGHNLQTVKISFQSEYVKARLSEAPPSDSTQRWVRKLTLALKELRGIKEVDLDVDLPIETKDDIVTTMLTGPSIFFKLPYNVRQMIYRYAADYNDGVELFRQHISNFQDHEMSTPTILMLANQITSEALDVVYSIPLVVSRLPDGHSPFDLLDFVSPGTFDRIRHLHLDIDRHDHMLFLPDIARSYNMDTHIYSYHELETFVLHYHEPHIRAHHKRNREQYPDGNLLLTLQKLNKWREINDVRITGTLPRCLSQPLEKNMMMHQESSPWGLQVLDADDKKIRLDDNPILETEEGYISDEYPETMTPPQYYEVHEREEATPEDLESVSDWGYSDEGEISDSELKPFGFERT